ncbi:MAG: hypothetical protein ACRDSK_04820 [Actinophytocola sp.]|uniref:hypothetical protein n=1 Tax=Actinophytocola sp. TaxID=1872138 RepID=UPI003D6BF974
MPIPRRVGKSLGAVAATVLCLVLLGGGGALIWFGVDMLDEFEPQNITYGSPTNPRIPDDEQRTDYILDTVLLVGVGSVLVVGTTIAAWSALKPSSR